MMTLWGTYTALPTGWSIHFNSANREIQMCAIYFCMLFWFWKTNIRKSQQQFLNFCLLKLSSILILKHVKGKGMSLKCTDLHRREHRWPQYYSCLSPTWKTFPCSSAIFLYCGGLLYKILHASELGKIPLGVAFRHSPARVALWEWTSFTVELWQYKPALQQSLTQIRIRLMYIDIYTE